MILRVFLFAYLQLLFSALSCQKKSEDCVYLLPQGFQGNVLIIFNQMDGKDITYESGKRVYRIDTSGVLKTKFKENYGKHQALFYKVDEKDTRIALRYLLPSQVEAIPKSSNEIFIYNLESGKDFETALSRDRHFELFTVSTLGNLDSIGNSKDRFILKYLDNKILHLTRLPSWNSRLVSL